MLPHVVRAKHPHYNNYLFLAYYMPHCSSAPRIRALVYWGNLDQVLYRYCVCLHTVCNAMWTESEIAFFTWVEISCCLMWWKFLVVFLKAFRNKFVSSKINLYNWNCMYEWWYFIKCTAKNIYLLVSITSIYLYPDVYRLNSIFEYNESLCCLTPKLAVSVKQGAV